jgi:hypothetical protein
MGINRYLSWDYRLSEASQIIPAHLFYSPDDLFRKSASTFEISQRGLFGMDPPIYSQRLELCEKKIDPNSTSDSTTQQ